MFGFSRNQVSPEALWAYRARLPDSLEVNVTPSESGGFVAVISNVPGCMTQGNSFDELNRMINYAVYDYYKIPKDYFPYIHSYSPPQGLNQTLGDETQKKIIFKTA